MFIVVLKSGSFSTRIIRHLNFTLDGGFMVGFLELEKNIKH
jgi:hypothetical protein